MPPAPPVTLTIAGSDCSAGAGLQADLKTFSRLGTYGLTAVTCTVAEIPGSVGSVAPTPPEVLAEQLDLLAGAFPIAAVKTGMLFSAAHAAAVVAWLRSLDRRPPVVVDPVMVATAGQRLLEDDAVDVLRDELFPLATVVTPNLDEAAALGSGRVVDEAGLRGAATSLAARFDIPVLVKGGHLRAQRSAPVASDALGHPDGSSAVVSSHFVEGVLTHGTGCTYSAAITAHLALGHSLPDAVALAKRFVSRAIEGYFRWGETHALDHLQHEHD